MPEVQRFPDSVNARLLRMVGGPDDGRELWAQQWFLDDEPASRVMPPRSSDAPSGAVYVRGEEVADPAGWLVVQYDYREEWRP